MAGQSGHLLGDDESETWTPNTDVCEGKDLTVVRMELPGLTADQVEIHVEENTLFVGGERPDPACEDSAAGYRFRQLEIQYGPFRRVIQMPYPVDGTRAKADLQQGMLEIRLPRARSDRQKTIKVKIDG
jgi:HSP20 family protein